MSDQDADNQWDEREQEQLQLPVFHSDPTKTDEQKKTNAGEDEKENLNSMLSYINNKFFVNRAAAWTAAFTCVLAIFSILLWEANRQANESSIASQRAFITFSGPLLEKIAEGNNAVTTYRVHMPMGNGGNTATQWSEFEESATVQDSPPDEGTNFDALPQSQRFRYVFGPKQVYDPQGTPLNVSDFEDLGRGKHVFVWGWVVYRDIFPDTEIHLSEYCLVYTNPKWTGPRHNDAAVDMRVTQLPCPTHYCYDHQCSDYSKRIQGYK